MKKIFTLLMALLMANTFYGMAMANTIDIIPIIWTGQTHEAAYHQEYLGNTLPAYLTDEWLTRGNGSSAGCLIRIDDLEQSSSLIFNSSYTYNNYVVPARINANWTGDLVESDNDWWTYYSIDFVGDVSPISRLDFSATYGTLSDSDYLDRSLPSPPVPEPATMFLFGLGLLGLTGISRK